MKLAINYSPQAETLVREEGLALDLFKCPTPSDPVIVRCAPDLLTRAAACLPIYVHFPLSAGDGGMQTTDWAEVDNLRSQTGTPYVNLHLRAEIADFPSMHAGTTAVADLNRLTEVFVQEVSVVTDRFGAGSVIVENVSYRGPDGKVLYGSVDPHVISKVLTETGTGLLLDTAHARLTCAAVGIDVYDYAAALPLERLREIHVTGALTGEIPMRDSMPMAAEDWGLFEWVFARIAAGSCPTPWAIALEYGGVGATFDWRSDPAVIVECIGRLRAMIG